MDWFDYSQIIFMTNSNVTIETERRYHDSRYSSKASFSETEREIEEYIVEQLWESIVTQLVFWTENH